jgi:hypothetical protein
MKRKSFYMWLRQQRWRDDQIGDLAKDLWDDRRNLRDHTLSAIRARIIASGGCWGALAALDAAVAEYTFELAGLDRVREEA